MIYRLTRQAQSDIKDIYRYTVEYFGEEQAREYLDGLEYSFDLLTDNPKIGRLWDGTGRRNNKNGLNPIQWMQNFL